MEKYGWPDLDHVATSSPKKRSRGTKPKLNNNKDKINRKGNVNEDANNVKSSLQLGVFNFEFSDAEIINHSRSLSPIRSSNTSKIMENIEPEKEKEDDDDNEEGEIHNISQKVTSFEKNDSNSTNFNSKSNNEMNENLSSSDEEVNESLNSNKSEGEITIQKVKEFIESKRKELDKERRLKAKKQKKFKSELVSKSNSLKNPQKINKPDHRKLKINQDNVIDNVNLKDNDKDNDKVDKQKLIEHSKTLKKLIHEIHKLPYDIEWKAKEWRLFQEYLNEWKLSGDDNMFQPVVLQDLFNCGVIEIETRMNSLLKFMHWKKRNI